MQQDQVHNSKLTRQALACAQITTAMVPTARWQQKYGACVLLGDLIRAAPQATATHLPIFIGPLQDLMVDAREEVKAAALDAMHIALGLVGNRDLDGLLQVRTANVLCVCSVAQPELTHIW